MPFTPGTRLGPYEIVGPIGAGGMGEVYRARDTRLNRIVAIKTLPSAFSHDEQRRSRFLREAKAISALSHPNICTLHDVGSENGIDYLVMEYVEGETLSDRMRKGLLPIDVAIKFAIEIADALEKAHRSGIVHRDLKPGNIMLSKSGVKLLDFGLAKSIAPRANFESETAPLTAAGMMVGTLDYMAPEQLEGEEADQRSDIFAFGNVLYRMLTGRAPFEAATDTALVGAILHTDPPPISAYRADVPPALARLIHSCLEKDRDDRIESAHDLKLQLQWIGESKSETDVTQRIRPRRPHWLAWSIVALVIAGALMTAYRALFRTTSRAPAAVQRFTIELPPYPGIFDSGVQDIAIAPDGNRLVASFDIGDGRQLYVRASDRPEVVAIPGTRNAANPFFSPDGQWVGFSAGGKLQKVSLRGGSPVVICDSPRGRGATWGPDNTIVFAPMSSGDGLWRVSADGGQARRLTTLDKSRNEHSHRWPHFLPDGKQVLFSIDDWGADYTRKKIAVADLESGRFTILLDGGSSPRYVDPGYLIFVRERALYAVKFDPKRLAVSGLAIPVVDDVVTFAGTGSVQGDVSRSGTLVYLPYDAVAEERELVWVDRNGSAQPLSNVRRPYVTPRLSPDQKQLVVGAGETRAADLWLLNVVSNTWSRIAPQAKSLYPLWSRDGQTIFFSSNRFGPHNIFSIPADGNGPAKQLTKRLNWPFAVSVSPDDRVLLVEEQHPVTSFDLWSVRTDGSQVTPLLTEAFNEAAADFSPDGRWFAYTSSETGRNEVYVQRFPPSGRKWAVSADGGSRPKWSSRGGEIFFTDRGKIMVASVVTAPEVMIGRPRVLFEGDYSPDYDVAADGQRFVMVRNNKRLKEPIRLAVVLGWPRAIEERMAAGSP